MGTWKKLVQRSWPDYLCAVAMIIIIVVIRNVSSPARRLLDQVPPIALLCCVQSPFYTQRRWHTSNCPPNHHVPNLKTVSQIVDRICSFAFRRHQRQRRAHLPSCVSANSLWQQCCHTLNSHTDPVLQNMLEDLGYPIKEKFIPDAVNGTLTWMIPVALMAIAGVCGRFSAFRTHEHCVSFFISHVLSALITIGLRRLVRALPAAVLATPRQLPCSTRRSQHYQAAAACRLAGHGQTSSSAVSRASCQPTSPHRPLKQTSSPRHARRASSPSAQATKTP